MRKKKRMILCADAHKVEKISREIRKFLTRTALDLDQKARVLNYWKAIKKGTSK